MATIVFNKSRFLEWVARQIEEDELVLVSSDLTGNVTANQKKNEKKVTVAFTADTFRRKGDIGHIAFGQTPFFGTIICNRSEASPATIKMLDEDVLAKGK